MPELMILSTAGRHKGRVAMGILTADMKRVVGEQRLGFVATVCPDGMPGAPRLSGMAITSSLPTSDRRHAREPANVLDPFVRRGYRFIVVASILESGAPYDKVLAYDWGRRARSVIRERS